MNNDIRQQDTLDSEDFNRKKLPTGLNVLTILSFIGCAIQLIGACWGFFTAKTSYEKKDEVLEQMKSGQMPAWAKSMMGDPQHYEQMMVKNFENRIPIFILSLVAVSLCFYGLLQMRKLKKQGYTFYVIGELLPFATMALFVGMFTFSGTGFMIGTAIALLFIIMYTTYRKNLVY